MISNGDSPCMQVHGLHMDSGCLASLDPLGTDQAPFRAAATVLAHLRHGPSLCSLLGLKAEPNLDIAQRAQDDSTFAPSLSGPDARGTPPDIWILSAGFSVGHFCLKLLCRRRRESLHRANYLDVPQLSNR